MFYVFLLFSVLPLCYLNMNQDGINSHVSKYVQSNASQFKIRDKNVAWWRGFLEKPDEFDGNKNVKVAVCWKKRED